jgi:hypothetical protein
MVPADIPLPRFPDDKCGVKDFMNDAAAEREFARFLDENFPRDKFGEFRAFLDDGAEHPFRPLDMYRFVGETRDALRMIAAHQTNRSPFNPMFYFPWEKVAGWKIDRIRVCESCGSIFFATRRNKLTCSNTCSTARRVREWRKRQSQYELARKKKSARPSRKIPTKKLGPKKNGSPQDEQRLGGGRNVTRKTR